MPLRWCDRTEPKVGDEGIEKGFEGVLIAEKRRGTPPSFDDPLQTVHRAVL